MKSDRSWHASISAPDGWGPGPWDPMYWEGTWRDRVDQYGNLRSWPADLPFDGHRVTSTEFSSFVMKDRVRHAPRHLETVLALCWCEYLEGEVPTEWIRERRTYECDSWCRRRYAMRMK